MTAVRGLLSTCLLLLGLVLVAVAVPAVWADQYVLETEPYTDAVAPLIEEPEVQEQVVAAMADPISERLSLPRVLDQLLVEATAAVVKTDGFAEVWTNAVRLSHQHLVEGLRDEGTGVNLADDGIVVDRAVLIEALKPRLAEAGLPFANQIPPGEGSVVLAAGPDVARAAAMARFVDTWASWLAAAAALTLLAGVVLAGHRPRALVVAGAGVVGVCALLWVAFAPGGETTGLLSELDDGRRSAVLVWDALAAPLAPLLTRVGIAGAVTAGVGAFWWLVRR